MTCGVNPFGCRHRRSIFTGGSSSEASTSARRTFIAALFAATSIQCRSTANEGFGSSPFRIKSTARRAAGSDLSSSDRSGKTAAKPADASKTLRSRKGISSCSARRKIISRLGCERPISKKLKCLCEISASLARLNWLKRRRSRHSRKRSPTFLDSIVCTGKIYITKKPNSITCEVVEDK